MKLVLIHGRSQAGKDPVALKKEWLDALTYGVTRANRILPPGATVEFPFYGDELEALLQASKVPLGEDIQARGTDGDADEAMRGEILMEMAISLGVTEADVAREFAGQPTAKGPQNWEWVQAILRAIDRVPGLNSSVIDALTRDVYVYLTFPGVRAKINGLVNQAIGNDPCVVVAHSLGTVVAYNVLATRAGQPVCPRFVTLGSPLGIKGINRHVERPLRNPRCVKSWFNAYDDRDVVALLPLDARNFDIAPPIENKSDVMNFTDNRHGITGYLADAVVAAKIVEYL